jgi:hypothetical protein
VLSITDFQEAVSQASGRRLCCRGLESEMRTPREVAEEAVAEIVLTANFEHKRRILTPMIAAWGVELLREVTRRGGLIEVTEKMVDELRAELEAAAK